MPLARSLERERERERERALRAKEKKLAGILNTCLRRQYFFSGLEREVREACAAASEASEGLLRLESEVRALPTRGEARPPSPARDTISLSTFVSSRVSELRLKHTRPSRAERVGLILEGRGGCVEGGVRSRGPSRVQKTHRWALLETSSTRRSQNPTEFQRKSNEKARCIAEDCALSASARTLSVGRFFCEVSLESLESFQSRIFDRDGEPSEEPW